MKKGIIILFLLLLAFVGWLFWPLFERVAPIATRVILHQGASIKEDNGRTNVVLLGIGGGSHEGPNLTDTIMLASIDWKKNDITLVSIPRDLWVPDLNNGVNKINEAYNLGGLSKAEAVVHEVTGQSVHYGLRLDFQGFVDAIDAIGGVDVTVTHKLDDYNYPISGKEDDICSHTPDELQAFNATHSASLTPETDTFNFFACRFKHLHFDPGQQHMDGETALEFARSRHGVGSEGSDFARSARQQLIIEAVRNKLITSAFFNPSKLLNLFDIVKNSVDTDISQEEVGLFLNKILFFKNAKIASTVIDYGDYTTARPGLLQLAPIAPEYDNLSVLIPRVGNGNFSEIQAYIACEIAKGGCKVSNTPITPTTTATGK